MERLKCVILELQEDLDFYSTRAHEVFLVSRELVDDGGITMWLSINLELGLKKFNYP